MCEGVSYIDDIIETAVLLPEAPVEHALPQLLVVIHRVTASRGVTIAWVKAACVISIVVLHPKS